MVNNVMVNPILSEISHEAEKVIFCFIVSNTFIF